MVPPIVATRAKISREIDALSDQLDERELALFIDSRLQRSRLPELDKAIAEYAVAMRDFDDCLATPGAQHGMLDTSPRSFPSKMREMRDEVAKGQRPGGMMGTTFMSTNTT
jgi:hypothetical protein